MYTPQESTIEERIEHAVTNGRGFEHVKNYREDDHRISPYAKLDQQLAYMDHRDGKTKSISGVIEHDEGEREFRGWVYEKNDRYDKKVTDEDRFLYALDRVLDLLGGGFEANWIDSLTETDDDTILDQYNTSSMDVILSHISPETGDKREFDQSDFDRSPGDPLGRVDVPNGTWHHLTLMPFPNHVQPRYTDDQTLFSPCKDDE